MNPVYGLTEQSKQNFERLVSHGDQAGGRARSGALSRGVCWVKVTGAPSGDWHPGVVTVDDLGEWSDQAAPVLVAAADGGPLAAGRYLCTRTGDDPGTRKARFRTLTAAAGVWAAVLTATDAGRWKYTRQTLDGDGLWVDDGAESADYTAVPSTIDGTNYAGAAVGLRVLMWQSKQPAYQEFIPVGYATATEPGLVSVAAQDMGQGEKRFEYSVVVGGDGSGEYGPGGSVTVHATGDPFLSVRRYSDDKLHYLTAGETDAYGEDEWGVFVDVGHGHGGTGGVNALQVTARDESGTMNAVVRCSNPGAFWHGSRQGATGTAAYNTDGPGPYLDVSGGVVVGAILDAIDPLYNLGDFGGASGAPVPADSVLLVPDGSGGWRYFAVPAAGGSPVTYMLTVTVPATGGGGPSLAWVAV